MLKTLLNRILPAAASAKPAGAPLPALDHGDVARADTLVEQGNGLEDAGDLDGAEARYREAVAAAPGHARAHLNLGIALAAKGDTTGAERAYEACLAIAPDHPFGNYNYARLAFLREDFARAESLIAAALRARPDFPQALVVQSNVLDALGKTEAAIEAMEVAQRLQPDDLGGWFNLAIMLQKAGRPDAAEGAVNRVLAVQADNLAALELAMRIHANHGFAAEALAPIARIVQLEPTAWAHRSFELMLMNFAGGVSSEALFRRHLDFGRDLALAVPVRFDRWRERLDDQRRLRIGYMSCDLQSHPVAAFLAPVIENHDRSRVEVFCYAFGDRQPDAMTARLRKASDHWRDAAALSDEQLAQAIHDDGIDVLVDLVGHTSQPRLSVFRRRPAPVQASWLGYLNTTGLAEMDFRLCDVRTDPPAISQPQHTERLLFLPDSQWCYRPLHDVAVDPIAPFERHGWLTYGSFNAALKITPAICRAWGKILQRTPGSRLVVADIKSERKRQAMLADLASEGVAAERVEFLPRVPIANYLNLFNRVDIALDTVPYGGGTTTLDALWMGVPVVAAVGDTPVSRSAASVLAYLGMDEWIAPSIDVYADVAVARAADRGALAALRRGLRPKMAASRLTDVTSFVADLEAAYRTMWLEKVPC